MPVRRIADLASLKAAAAGRWLDILVAVGGIPTDILDGRHHPCPKCGGRDRFRLIDAEAGAVLCNQCFTNRNGDGIASVAWLRGLGMSQAAGEIAAYLGVDWEPGKPTRKHQHNQDGESAASEAVYLSPEHVAAEVIRGHPAKPSEQGRAKLARVDDYGTFRVLRIDLPTAAGEKQRKSFRPVHPITLADGRTAWRKGYPPGTRPLFRLAELAWAPPDLCVVVAGEKAAEASAGLGLVATTNAGGERAIEKTDWTPLSRFAQVVVSVDNDPTGKIYGELVAAAVRKLSPSPAVKVIQLPGLPEKGDVVEWIAAGGTREAFITLVAAACEHKADPLVQDRAICEALGIDVLGELPDGSIRVFADSQGKNVTVQRVSFLTYQDALQRFGPAVRAKIYRGKDEVPPGMFSLDRMKDAIAILGGSERAGQNVECGQGVWLGKNGGESIVLVGCGAAAVWDGAELRVVRKPRVAGLKVDLDVPYEMQWFDANVLRRNLESAANHDWCNQTLDEAFSLFKKWYWRADQSGQKQDIVPELIPGLIMATWLQTTWLWRPHVGIPGASDAGKSLLFGVLESIFGPMAVLSSKSTAAGIRQAVGNHARIILCDEFESDNHRREILEFFRTGSAGSKTLRGTSNQQGIGYGLRHMCWVAAIELGLLRQPDKNRYLQLELVPPAKEIRGKIQLPTSDQLRDMGQRLLACAVRYSVEARRIFNEIKSSQVEGVHGRTVESYAVPVSITAAVTGCGVEQAQRLLNVYFRDLEQDASQATKDEVELLGAILDADVSIGPGRQATVGQILSAPSDYDGGWDTLARVGIALAGNSTCSDPQRLIYDRHWLFISHRTVLAKLLRGSQWTGQNIDQILKRLPGARRNQRIVAGNRPRGVEIPWQYIRSNYLTDPENPDSDKQKF